MRMQRVSRINFLLFSLLVAIQPALAQKSETAKTGRLPLWKVEGITNKVYLLGSVHVLSKTNYPLPAPIEAAFKEVQVAAFEADFDELMQSQMKLLAKSQLPEGQSLKDQLSEGTYKEFMKYADKSGLPEVMLSRFKPPMAAVTLLSVELMKMGLLPEFGVDQHFYKLATENKKKTEALETVDFQIDLLTSFSKEEGEQMVKSMIKEMDNVQKSIGDMVKAWETGDAAGLDKLLNDSMDDSPAVLKRLLTDRSEDWVSKIQEMIKGGKNVMVIVGAGHLVGEKGVVELLKKKGLKVTQM